MQLQQGNPITNATTVCWFLQLARAVLVPQTTQLKLTQQLNSAAKEKGETESTGLAEKKQSNWL